MGMFDKDRLFGGARLDVEFVDGEPFVLFDAEIVAEGVDLGNDLPPAAKTGLVVGKLKSDGELDGDPYVVGTLGSAIASKVRDKAPGDLPCVVMTETVPTDLQPAKVLTYVGPYNGKVPATLPNIETVTLSDAAPAA